MYILIDTLCPLIICQSNVKVSDPHVLLMISRCVQTRAQYIFIKIKRRQYNNQTYRIMTVIWLNADYKQTTIPSRHFQYRLSLHILHHWYDMAGNDVLLLLESSYISKIVKRVTLNKTKQARNSRPDPRRDSCMYVVTDTSGSSEMCAEQQYMRSGGIVKHHCLVLLFLHCNRAKGKSRANMFDLNNLPSRKVKHNNRSAL